MIIGNSAKRPPYSRSAVARPHGVECALRRAEPSSVGAFNSMKVFRTTRWVPTWPSTCTGCVLRGGVPWGLSARGRSREGSRGPVIRALARTCALQARSWTSTRASGSALGKGADFESPQGNVERHDHLAGYSQRALLPNAATLATRLSPSSRHPPAPRCTGRGPSARLGRQRSLRGSLTSTAVRSRNTCVCVCVSPIAPRPTPRYSGTSRCANRRPLHGLTPCCGTFRGAAQP